MSRIFDGDALDRALAMARLDLPAERVDLVRAAAESTYAALDGLDTLALGETPPATAFNARWK